ncbi:homogentisate 1,2-dioxygenase [Streptomyces sp. NPDC057428]|uniref:homogentisate 1,2-dioxygenase n=1 Tax=Streptomyces sp. NPDC057428 TaxID=3346129 RepID=UPI0036BF3BA0
MTTNLEREAAVRERARKRAASLTYSTGFGNEHSSEALAGALPVGRNSPHLPPHGLYTELLSETAFTETRPNTRRTWMYRIRPSVVRPRQERMDNGTLLTPPFVNAPVDPHSLYWKPRPAPAQGTDFVAGLWTLAGNGDPRTRSGMAVHLYTADVSMTDRVFSTSDGQLLIVPEQGGLLIHTELGLLGVEPGHIALIPRGMKFRVEILGTAGDETGTGFVRGYVFENFGTPFSLPELGFVGQSGMSNPRDFLAPAAAYDDSEEPVEVITKVYGDLWTSTYDHSPLDVVAWHGNSVPYVYNLRDFQVMASVNYDHRDPSLLTALTSTTSTPGLNNIDFCAVPPEWVVTDAFRPPYYHRNVNAEFVGVIEQAQHVTAGLGGAAADDGYVNGIAGIVNPMNPHGPGADAWEGATNGGLDPMMTDGLLFVVETQWPLVVTEQAVQTIGQTSDETLSGNSTLQSQFRY